jgi:hypothetical protein
MPLGAARRVLKTVAMTQRMELATVMDRLAIDALITDYAVAVDDGDWAAYRELFTSDGRADYRSAGGIEGDVAQVAGWLAGAMELFPMRQHLIVNRRVRFGIRLRRPLRVLAPAYGQRLAAAPGRRGGEVAPDPAGTGGTRRHRP